MIHKSTWTIVNAFSKLLSGPNFSSIHPKNHQFRGRGRNRHDACARKTADAGTKLRLQGEALLLYTPHIHTTPHSPRRLLRIPHASLWTLFSSLFQSSQSPPHHPIPNPRYHFHFPFLFNSHFSFIF